ncbi:ATP-dependent RNA helicase dbp6, partial [Lunasporangiospora selenospora]
RLIDHVKSTPGFTLQHLRFLVIDEADRLLNQSFQEWLFHVLRAIHPSVPDPSSIPSSLSVVDRDESNEARDKNQDSKALTTKADLKRDHLGFPIHDAIAPAFLPSFFRLADSEVEDPKVLSVQKLLFSATLTRNPAKIASLQLSDPQYVAVQELGEDGEEKQKYTTPAGLTEHMIVCETSDKPLMVLHLLHHLQVRSALCFTKSVESAHRLCKLIQLYEQVRVLDTSGKEKTFSVDANDKTEKEVEDEQGSDNDDGESGSESDNGSNSDSEDEDKEAGDVEMEDADADQAKPTTTGSTDPIIVAEFSSDLPKAKRAQILRQFSAGQIHLLICSDLIVRGMDLAPVENVINYDVPVYMKKYIHRVGRTARAGKSGTAYSLVEMQEARHFREMMVKAGHWDRVEKIKVRSAETQDLVPTYTTALAGLKSELSASARAKRRHGHARRPPQ